MNTLKRMVVLLALAALLSSVLFATGAKEIIEEGKTVEEAVVTLVEEQTQERVHYGTVDKEDMFSSFSYAYGYAITKTLTSQGISLNGAYWLRGIKDVLEFSETPLVSTDAMSSVVDEYVNTFYAAGLTSDSGDMPSLDALAALTAPESLVDKFSYSYGAMYAIQLYYYNGLDITCGEFLEGAADAIWENENPQMTEEESEAAIEKYAAYLDEEYEKFLEELKKENLAAAEAFLESNKATEGVIILPSGNQMVITSEGEELGATPASTDSVVVDYDLFLLDGQQYDSGRDVTFSLSSLIPGFTEAVTNMRVGQEATVYIHPQYGYGESGTNTIEPNSLLVFRIALKAIAEN
ncbi:MAG: FKBP-type peptidyl-prolyl cis-trans isomerase N-terminal domain-containing protein [Candidatus Ornithospirochaeta sp.]